MENLPCIDIHIITMNGVHHLQRLLPSLVKTRYPNYRVFLLDNSSNEEAATYAKSIVPSLVHLDFEKNVGFAKANNEGLKRSIQDGIQFAVLLNDDTEILDPDWLHHGLQTFQSDENIAVVGFHEVNTNTPTDQPPPLRDVDWVKGYCMAIRTSALADSGLFDELFFAYHEERDLQASLKKQGARIVIVGSPVFHLNGGSFGRGSQYAFLMIRNALRFSLKHESLLVNLLRPLQLILITAFPVSVLKTPASLQVRSLVYSPRAAARNFLFCCWSMVWNAYYAPSIVWKRTLLRKSSRN